MPHYRYLMPNIHDFTLRLLLGLNRTQIKKRDPLKLKGSSINHATSPISFFTPIVPHATISSSTPSHSVNSECNPLIPAPFDDDVIYRWKTVWMWPFEIIFVGTKYDMLNRFRVGP